MKKLFIFLFIICFSIGVQAQLPETEIDFPKMNFNTVLQNDTFKHFKISPFFKPGTLPGDSLQFNPQDSLLYSRNFPKYELRMPVAGVTRYLNMPVAVPDSSVHYFIKQKRIEFFNPLEYNRK